MASTAVWPSQTAKEALSGQKLKTNFDLKTRQPVGIGARHSRRLAHAKRLTCPSLLCSAKQLTVLGRPGGYGEGSNTRSHPELGRENPQRRWYCVLRRGRVGRRQVFQARISRFRKKAAMRPTSRVAKAKRRKAQTPKKHHTIPDHTLPAPQQAGKPPKQQNTITRGGAAPAYGPAPRSALVRLITFLIHLTRGGAAR